MTIKTLNLKFTQRDYNYMKGLKDKLDMSWEKFILSMAATIGGIMKDVDSNKSDK